MNDIFASKIRESLRLWMNTPEKFNKTKSIILSYGVEKLVEIPDEKYEEIFKRFEALMAELP